MIKKYSEEKRQEVIEARKDGATIAQIAVMAGVGQTTVKAWLKNGSSGDFQDLGDTYMFKEALRSIYRQSSFLAERVISEMMASFAGRFS